MKLYLTTCRKPTQATRRLAKFLSRFFGWELENRGKRSMDEIVGRAHSEGLKRIVFIYEEHGSPSELAFYEEGWLKPRLQILSSEIELGRGRFDESVDVQVKDGVGEKLASGLFAVEGSDDGESKAYLSADEIILESGANVLRLKIRVVGE